jgi:hypothetical protein
MANIKILRPGTSTFGQTSDAITGGSSGQQDNACYQRFFLPENGVVQKITFNAQASVESINVKAFIASGEEIGPPYTYTILAVGSIVAVKSTPQFGWYDSIISDFFLTTGYYRLGIVAETADPSTYINYWAVDKEGGYIQKGTAVSYATPTTISMRTGLIDRDNCCYATYYVPGPITIQGIQSIQF